MAWMASPLFLKGTDHDAAVTAMETLMSDTAHRLDQAGIIGAPPPILVSPAHEGWIAVTGAAGWLYDLPWAADQLAERCGDEVLCCLIFGNCYRLQLTRHQGGDRQTLIRTPDDDWSDQNELSGPMPLYEDIEKLAYEHLRAEQVPAPLVAIGTAPLGCTVEEELSAGQGTSLTLEVELIKSQAPLALPSHQDPDPPVLPSGVSRDFGLTLFEARYVEGNPTVEALDRLIAIEEEIMARAQRAEPKAELSLTVTYHAGRYQDRLDGMLRKRGRPTAAYAERGAKTSWWKFWRYFGRTR